jgi:hypothetical protein
LHDVSDAVEKDELCAFCRVIGHNSAAQDRGGQDDDERSKGNL